MLEYFWLESEHPTLQATSLQNCLGISIFVRGRRGYCQNSGQAKKMVGDQIKPLICLWHELHVHLTVQPQSIKTLSRRGYRCANPLPVETARNHPLQERLELWVAQREGISRFTPCLPRARDPCAHPEVYISLVVSLRTLGNITLI